MKRIITLLFLFPLAVIAQLNITSTTWSEVAITPNAITRVGVFGQNTSGSMVQIHTTIVDDKGVKLLDVISTPITISSGVQMLSPSTFSQVRYAQNSTGDYIKVQSALPIGTYTFCIELLSNTIEVLDRYCESIVSSRDEFLNLVYPMNGDSVYTVYPNLSWSHSGNFGDATTRYYRIVLSELERGQTNEEALNLNQPFWISAPLNAHVISYPQNAPRLQEGKTYVWQVQLLYNGMVAQSSEIWRFKVAQKPIYRDLEYISLTRNSSIGLIEAFNFIHVRFDEPTNNNQIVVSAIFSGDINKRIDLPFELKVAPDSGGNAIYLLKVDVSKLTSESKPYKLSVRSGQGIDYGLNFIKK